MRLDEIKDIQTAKELSKNRKVSPELAFLDDPKNLKDWAQNESQTEFILKVSGLECASCVHLIEKIPEYYNAVKSIEVDYGKAQILIQLERVQGLSEFVQILKEWGYDSAPMTPMQLIQPGVKLNSRSALKRLAVAGAITGNIMLFAIPVYSGLSGELRTAFLWIQFVIFLPLFFYSAVPFYRSAWNSLMMRTISVDLPMTLALSIGFFLSTYNLLQNSDEVYFDSMASFIFLILVARYFVQVIQQKSEFHFSLESFIPPQTYLVQRNNRPVELHPHEIAVGEKIQLRKDQILPLDCTLGSNMADFDTSLFSGESFPQTYSCGMKIFAGTKLLSSTAEVYVREKIENSALSNMLKHLEKSSLTRNKFTKLTDLVSQYLIAIVFGTALIYFLFHFEHDFKTTFQRTLALLIIACPCALAFGSPLSFALGLKKAKEKGILIKNPEIFEKVRQIKNIFLDKTGTLTQGQLSLERSIPEKISPQFKSIILSLESGSEHPVAFGFRKAWAQDSNLVNIQNRKEILGLGVEGDFEGKHYSLEKSESKDSSGMICVTLKQNDSALAYFYFVDQPMNEAKNVIQELRRRFNVFIISGDRKANVHFLAKYCGIHEENCFSECSPELKQKILEKHPQSMMVGDGLNDLLAFQQADIGVSVQGSHLKNQNVADVLFLKAGPQPLVELIQISDQTYKCLTSNLTFALFYNLVAGFFALSGYVNPLVAALLMPASSLIILGRTFWGMR